MPLIRRLLLWALAACLLLAVAASIGLATLYYTVSGKLPDPQALRNVELQEPLYVYASDGRLIGLFGETRRYPIAIANVPEPVKQAFIAAEDASFYQHNGISFKGISRALWQIASRKKGRVAGGSTITQQVARQFFLSNDYKYSRKLAEMLLAMKIEKTLSKDEILELYLNKSFFGNRSYGIAAAAEFYYGKHVDELTLMEAATLVSTLKFPSSGNPISNPQRNHERSVYVIQRMLEEGHIRRDQADTAMAEAMHAAPHERPVEVPAPHMAEMVRQEMIARFGGDVLNKGYSVTTTIDADAQLAADKSLREGLDLYDSRRGWHGVEQHVDLPADAGNTALAARLDGIATQANLVPVIVASTSPDGSVRAVDASGREIPLPSTAAARWKKKPAELLKRGDITRIRADGEKPGEYLLAQVPQAQSALVSLDANSGAIHALVGGYSFAGNKFNRATQARRQPGSSFKPFIYAAALDKGFNPGSIVLDAPVVFRDRRGNEWRPQNDRGGFDGPMRLREALVRSKNLVSVRLLDSIGVQYASDYITRFGFDKAELPPNLSMSLGTASLTPLSMARGYSVFANGGSQITPWFIDEVKDRNGKLIFKETPALACHNCSGQALGDTAASATVVDGFDFGSTPPAAETTPNSDIPAPAEQVLPQNPEAPRAPQTVDGRTIYQLVSMMRDVVLRGTGTPARALNREDVGGKTGSTNDYRDAWFGGFGGGLATVVWVGRDDFRTLGSGEYGGRAALPIWIDYMRVALQDRPITRNDPPEGMVQVETNGVTEWIKTEDAERVRNEHLFNSEESARDEQAFDIF